MHWFWRVLVMLVCPVAAFAAPEPPPPALFVGAQYIDGRGCVFSRQADGWQARLDPSGRPLCGFPPSQDLRRLDPDTSHVLPSVSPPAAPDPALLLAERLAAELRNADMNAEDLPDLQPPVSQPPVSTGNPLMEHIAATVAHQATVRSAMAPGGRVPAEVCARLGYHRDPIEAGVADATGFCPGLRPPAPGPSFADAPRTPQPIARQPAPAPGLHRPQQAPRPSAVSAQRMPRAAAAPPQGVEMIPASARYVQIGVFQDEPSAKAAIRTLARIGLPVAQGRQAGSGARTIMAGPFTDRGRLVEVLNRLRAQGWPGAVAR